LYAHALLLREPGGAAAVSNNSHVDLYGKCGAMALARQVFDRMPVRDLGPWNAI
jgi:hypothetical protein